MATYNHPICPCCEYAEGGRPCTQFCCWAGNSNENLFTPVRASKAERREMKERQQKKQKHHREKFEFSHEKVHRHTRHRSER